MKACSKCKVSKPLADYGNNKRNKDKKQIYCKRCAKDTDRKHYVSNPNRRTNLTKIRRETSKRNREFVLEHLAKNQCKDCGEKDIILLEFDHVRGNKKIEVSTMVNRGVSLASLQEEISKCDVRCVKCHRIKTAKDQGWYEPYKKYRDLPL